MLHIPGPTARGHACPDLRTMGTPTEGPPLPSGPVSKHTPPAKKTPGCDIRKYWPKCYDFGVERGLPLSPFRGGPAFLLPAPRSYAILGRLGNNRLHAEDYAQERDEAHGNGGKDWLNVRDGDTKDLVA